MSTITKISVTVEINGEPYFVLIPKNAEQLIVDTAMLCNGGKLRVAPLPEGYRFMTLRELEEGAK